GLINYMNQTTKRFGDLYVLGYNFVPPTPFHLKDWEKYDISRYVDVGAVSPERGTRTVEISNYEKKYTTIKDDLKGLSDKSPPEKSIYLFHSPPYDTSLDRAALDEKMIDHAPVDNHVGSIAIKRFIKEEQPLVTLHGHVHETVDITGEWREKIGETFSFTGVHNGPELPIIRFDTEELERTTRTLIRL
ncbi:MAG: metallophosphoesterase family protein, partial [Candidatus Natronoplasma sp.]